MEKKASAALYTRQRPSFLRKGLFNVEFWPAEPKVHLGALPQLGCHGNRMSQQVCHPPAEIEANASGLFVHAAVVAGVALVKDPW